MLRFVRKYNSRQYSRWTLLWLSPILAFAGGWRSAKNHTSPLPSLFLSSSFVLSNHPSAQVYNPTGKCKSLQPCMLCEQKHDNHRPGYEPTPSIGWLQSFFRNTSWSICLSGLRSATICFSLKFSSSNCRRRRSSETPKPPNSLPIVKSSFTNTHHSTYFLHLISCICPF